MPMRFLPSRSEHAPQGGGDVVAYETSGHHHSHTLSQRIAWRRKGIDVNLSLSYILSLFLCIVNRPLSLLLNLFLSLSISYSFSFIFHMCTHCISCTANPPAVWKQECSPTKKGWLEACSNTCFSVNVLYIAERYLWSIPNCTYLHSTRFLTSQALGLECIDFPKYMHVGVYSTLLD